MDNTTSEIRKLRRTLLYRDAQIEALKLQVQMEHDTAVRAEERAKLAQRLAETYEAMFLAGLDEPIA